jgi:ribulose-phosphate 3-epimerase
MQLIKNICLSQHPFNPCNPCSVNYAPVCLLEDIICDVDMVLLMSVNPGFGGQKFIDEILAKTRRLRRMIDESGSKALIQIDGGVNAETAPLLVEAGADVLVSGSYIFKAADPIATIHDLKQL